MIVAPILDEMLCEDADVVLYRAHTEDGRRVLMKVLKSARPTSFDYEALRRDSELARIAGADVAAEPEGVTSLGGKPTLVLRDDGGTPLTRRLGTPMPLATFFPLAIELASAIEKVHARHLVHGELHPADVLELLDGRIELIGFGRVDCSFGSRPATSPVASLPYLAPEQIGRHPHVADERTDLYSLGVLLFEMLAGTRPFHASGLVGWIHAHCALPPPPLASSVPETPPALRGIVETLLSKPPEARYQSAAALVHDLSRAFEDWRSGSAGTTFPLGTTDRAPTLRVTGELHGRRSEVHRVKLAIARAHRPRAAELLFLSGPEGIGKSAIIQAALRETDRSPTPPRVATGQGHIRGERTPCGPLIEAFAQLLRTSFDVADESGAHATELQIALGPHLPLLAELIPELGRIVGATRRASEVPLPEARSRLLRAIDRLVSTFSTPERPLVLVLEQLQWSDAVTFDVLTHWALDPESPPVVILGTFRSEQVGDGHPLRILLEHLRDRRAAVDEIVVAPLAPEAVRTWLADVLRTAPECAAPLAELLCDRGRGNPFFMGRLLERLQDRGFIQWAHGRHWEWRIDEATLGLSSFTSARGLVSEQLDALSPSTRAALGLFATYGPNIHAEMLGRVLECTEPEAVQRLSEAFHLRLVSRSAGTICFVHATIAEVAYDALGAEQPGAHLRIARAMLDGPVALIDAPRAFAIVAHLDRAGALVDREDGVRAAGLHLLAARRAQSGTHFDAAIPLAERGAALLGERRWEDHHGLAFALDRTLARSRMVAGDAAGGRALATSLAERARCPHEVAAARGLLAELGLLEGDVTAAAAEAVAGLRDLGLELAEGEDPARGATHADAALEAIERLGPEAVIARAHPADERTRAIARLFASLFPPASFADASLLAEAAGKVVERCLQTGNAPGASIAYALLAARLAHVGRSREAERLGSAAYTLALRDEHAAERPRTSLVYLAVLGYRSRPVRECAALLHDEAEIARAIGDRPMAALLAKQAAHFRFFGGEALENVASDAAYAREIAGATMGSTPARLVDHLVKLVERLREPSSDPLPELEAESADEALVDGAAVERFERLCTETIARLIFDDEAGAARTAERALTMVGRVVGLIEVPQLQFFGGLAAARAPTDDPDERLACVEARCAALAALATECPSNFGARSALLDAERDRLLGDIASAERGYERAIRLACVGGQHHIEAIASERAARFYLERGDAAVANAYVAQALSCYAVWGATAKTARLVRDHPFLSERPALAPDVASIFEAQRALTSTLSVPELARRVIDVAMNHAQAQRGCLLHVAGERRLVLTAAGGAEASDFGAVGAAASPFGLPLSMCHAALRTKKPMLVADTVVANRYSRDPYFMAPRPRLRSALCVPIIHDDDVSAMLYVENEVVPGLFSPATLAVLDAIAKQAGVSLHNARRHAALEEETLQLRSLAAEVSKERRLFEAALDASPLSVLIRDLEGRYMFVNRKVEEELNIDGKLLLGKGDHDVFSQEVAERSTAFHRRVLAEERAVEVDETFDLGNGAHAFRTIVFPLRDEEDRPWAVCAIASDVTRRRLAEDELRRTLALVEATFESTQDGVLVTNLERKVIRYNRRFLEMWGLPEDAALHDVASDELIRIVRDQLVDPDAFVARVEELRRRPESSDSDVVHLRDGRVYELALLPQRVGGQVVGRVTSFHDVTDKVRAADERARLLAEEKDARRQAEDAVHARDEFLSIASHELRTPLASLSLAVEALGGVANGQLDPERVRRAAAIARRQVERIVSLVEMLLDVSRLRSGKLVLSLAPVDLRAVVGEVATLLASELARSGSKLEIHAPEAVVGAWDALRVEQVVTNLLTNAIKFGRGAPIDVSVTCADGQARFEVTDHGIGIPDERRSRIFEPFTRLVSSRHFGGLGLGLHITKTIVEAHGGRLDVESEMGVGSTFVVTLPVARPTGAAEE